MKKIWIGLGIAAVAALAYYLLVHLPANESKSKLGLTSFSFFKSESA